MTAFYIVAVFSDFTPHAVPAFLRVLRTILCLWRINDQSYGALRHCLDRHFSTWTAPGTSVFPTRLQFLGTDTERILWSLNSNPPSLLYTEIDVMGCHTPFLGIAKPIYLDGFFNAIYADLWYGNYSARTTMETSRSNGPPVKIYIDYALALQTFVEGPCWQQAPLCPQTSRDTRAISPTSVPSSTSTFVTTNQSRLSTPDSDQCS